MGGAHAPSAPLVPTPMHVGGETSWYIYISIACTCATLSFVNL